MEDSYNSQEYLVIHCTNGLNRTGYVVIYYLCKKFKMNVDEARTLFEEARGEKMENEEFIEDLKNRVKSFL